jgi:UDP-glucose 4-epimerase
MRILVTGGAGYIGSHTVLELLNNGHEVIVVDNLSNSTQTSLQRVQELAARTLLFHQVDIRDKEALRAVFRATPVDAVIHFAALKAVGESVQQPLRYYDNNVSGTLALCDVMGEAGVRNLVFSSSCTVYGDATQMPLREASALGRAKNPYGRSKQMLEDILRDLHEADPAWQIISLRYFNPIGAHESGRIGEDPQGVPNNLLPYVAQVAVGRRPYLRVFGDDYPTPDGTPIRDYIHVVDLALGHLKALDKLAAEPGYVVYNLGTGQGSSVFEVITAFERACGREIPYRVEPRRAGDADVAYADPGKAQRELGWTAVRDLKQMCRDAWRWQARNPLGYAPAAGHPAQGEPA